MKEAARKSSEHDLARQTLCYGHDRARHFVTVTIELDTLLVGAVEYFHEGVFFFPLKMVSGTNNHFSSTADMQ